MEKTLTKVGGSHALIIDKPVLELLGVGPETRFKVTTDGHRLVLTPMAADRDAKMQVAMDEVLNDHAELFEKLA